MAKTMLEVRELTTKYVTRFHEDVYAVDHVSLKIEDGKSLGIAFGIVLRNSEQNTKSFSAATHRFSVHRDACAAYSLQYSYHKVSLNYENPLRTSVTPSIDFILDTIDL